MKSTRKLSYVFTLLVLLSGSFFNATMTKKYDNDLNALRKEKNRLHREYLEVSNKYHDARKKKVIRLFFSILINVIKEKNKTSESDAPCLNDD